MPTTWAQKTVALSINLVVSACLSFGMALAIMWLMSFRMAERSPWWPLGYVAVFGIAAGYGLMMCVVSEFESRFERIYMFGIVSSMCGGMLFGSQVAVQWWYSAQTVDLAPYVMAISVIGSFVACAILHLFKPNIIPFVSE